MLGFFMTRIADLYIKYIIYVAIIPKPLDLLISFDSVPTLYTV